MVGIAEKIANIIGGIEPEISTHGRRFFGKMPSGPVMYYHYLFPPAKGERVSTYLGLDAGLEQYVALLEYSNGLMLFDRAIAIYGAGDFVSASLDPGEMTALSLERENSHFFLGRHDAVRLVIGRIDLSIRYNIEMVKSGAVTLRGEDGLEVGYEDLNSGLGEVLDYFQTHTTFGVELRESEIDAIERLLRG